MTRSLLCIFIAIAACALVLQRHAIAAPRAIGGADSAAASDAHAKLDEILHRPMYQAWRMRQAGHLPKVDLEAPRGLGDWFRRAGRALGELLDWLFNSRRSSSPFSASNVTEMLPTLLKTLGIIVLALGLAFAALLIFKAIARPNPQIAFAHVLSRQQVHDAMEAGDALALATGQWLDEARRLAAEQNFRAVYRALYLALLSGLHKAGKIEHTRNRTNWTYVRQYHGPSEERATFGELTDLFDRVWYGHHLTAAANDLDHLQRKVLWLTGEKELAR